MFKALGGNTNQYICSSTDIRHVHPTKNILDKQYLRPMQVCLLAILIQCYRILRNYSPIVNSFEVALRTRGVRYFYLLTTVDFYHLLRNFTVDVSLSDNSSGRIVYDKLVDFLLNCTSLTAFQITRNRKSRSDMADINIVGVVAIVVFYMLILGIGLWAAWRRKEGEEEAMLAGRSIGMVVGTFTLTGNIKI